MPVFDLNNTNNELSLDPKIPGRICMTDEDENWPPKAATAWGDALSVLYEGDEVGRLLYHIHSENSCHTVRFIADRGAVWGTPHNGSCSICP